VPIHDDGSAANEGRKNLFGRDVETQRGKLEHSIPDLQIAVFSNGRAMIQQGPMSDENSLGRTGRSRGVDHISDILGRDGARWIIERVLKNFVLTIQADNPASESRQFRQASAS
jgi:hypothetical protein